MHLTVAILRLLLCALKVTLLLVRENNTAAAMVPCSPATAARKDASTILPCTVDPVHRDRLAREIAGDLGAKQYFSIKLKMIKFFKKKVKQLHLSLY